MQIHLRKRSGAIFDTFDLSDDTTVEEFKEKFWQKHRFYPERQRWNVDKVDGQPLKEGTLLENAVRNGTILYFKDLGVQISWRLVFVLEYLGPLLIFPLFYFFPKIFYPTFEIPNKSLVQKVAFGLSMFHYLKRELETLFVHRFSNATMPIYRVPLNCGHYWGLFGVSVGYYLFHPLYLPFYSDANVLTISALAAVMLLFEALNFKTHLILRSLRPRGTKIRGIPMGWGFNSVCCANYYWETLAWVTFCILVHTVAAWIFTVVAFCQMAQWATKKNSQYLKAFDNYPKNRKAIIPYLL